MARPGLITVDLIDRKELFVEYCSGLNASPSNVIRALVDGVIANKEGGVADLGVASMSPPKGREQRKRVEIRLTESEYNALVHRVSVYGHRNVAQYIVSLVRSNLTRRPQVGDREYELLSESNRHLLAMGRNLNQIAKHLNKGGTVERFDEEGVAKLVEYIKNHAKQVSIVLSENVDRWSVG